MGNVVQVNPGSARLIVTTTAIPSLLRERER